MDKMIDQTQLLKKSTLQKQKVVTITKYLIEKKYESVTYSN
jgi:hypothetical protein